MSRKSSRTRTQVVTKQAIVPPANPAIVQQMAQQWGQTTYGPNAPILPYPGLQPPYGPRQFAYPIATNLNLVVRDNLTPFEVLRQFADLYDVIRLCLQNWFDCAANLEPDIVPVDGLLKEGETPDKYAAEIAPYKEFFEFPDKQHTIHEWMNAALEDLAVIDAVAIYPRMTYSGELYALDLIDGSTIKPMLDDRGRTPEPPLYAYEQIIYGAPSELFTSDELIYLKEHNRTKSAFGFSRVENIIMRINQALRKQNLDMALFTDGNIPAGWIAPSADVQWTPDQLMTYQTMLDALLAGNDAIRSRAKIIPPGSTFTPTNPTAVSLDLDMFALKITHGSFGVMPSQNGFIEDVNYSTSETQDDITYERTLRPIANRFARLFTAVLRKYFHETRFKFQWKGYEAKDDFSAMVKDHVSLVAAGIERADSAATALKLGDQGPEVPRFIMAKSGPFVVDDLANQQVRSAQVDALIEPPAPPPMEAISEQGKGTNEKDADEEGKGDESDPEEVKRLAQVDLAKWRNFAITRMQNGKSRREFRSDHIPAELHESIEQALAECHTVDEIRTVFDRAREGDERPLALASTPGSSSGGSQQQSKSNWKLRW